MKITVNIIAERDKLSEMSFEGAHRLEYPALEIPMLSAGADLAIMIDKLVNDYITQQRVKKIAQLEEEAKEKENGSGNY